ncbi:hypothetical protein DSL72_003427 [Monilinia vaccinii-corymbosi]|uniref:Uncharacterized protein n=1 Tax=Monilinia vaccinii-corymbosi TaxID=61207 RepID=A0A8A3NXV9_9HELO|nr:hypothetical protein DSL72_003427 [Monilinia vaccinii-corymbosi]
MMPSTASNTGPPTDERLLPKWIEGQPESNQLQLTRSSLDDFFEKAAQPRHVGSISSPILTSNSSSELSVCTAFDSVSMFNSICIFNSFQMPALLPEMHALNCAILSNSANPHNPLLSRKPHIQKRPV